jgi:glycosyltransferase involved in cell wall biosynthesis
MTVRSHAPTADVCLILEGTYPYVSGGVSTWTHDLIGAQKDLTFHVLTILAPGADLTVKYELPPNVVGTSQVFVQELPQGRRWLRNTQDLFGRLYSPLERLQSAGGLTELADLLRVLIPYRGNVGRRLLLDSKAAWDVIVRLYEEHFQHVPFVDYFWSWRMAHGALYSMLLSELPSARAYHTVSTGYAGLLAARAHLETGRPAVVTEHGIYTNERRIEIAMSDWPYDPHRFGFDIEHRVRGLKDLWIDTFLTYSRACYQASSQIVSLFEGNQPLQLEDGAPTEKLRVIPNGIDYKRFSSIPRDRAERPTVALVGRVVPVKDVKTFIRACGILRSMIPDVQGHIVGPTQEDPEYFDSCERLVEYLGLGETVKFLGQRKPEEFLGKIDVLVLTSISEAQPLVILEGGAAAIPTVATNVGACREMILGRKDERPRLGPGGAVTALSNPSATALALSRLLTDKSWYRRCSEAMRQRVGRYYSKEDQNRTYNELYVSVCEAPSVSPLAYGEN